MYVHTYIRMCTSIVILFGVVGIYDVICAIGIHRDYTKTSERKMKKFKEYRGRKVLIMKIWKSGSKVMISKEETLMNCELLCTDYLCLFIVSLIV